MRGWWLSTQAIHLNLPMKIFKKMNIYILHNILLIILTFPMNRSIPAFSPTSASLPFACAEIPMIYYQHWY
jgi:hypothetical protein